MLTGLLPSEHGAHFQTMGYTGAAPTVAELLEPAGYHTELVTRNFVFDGTIPGITRGFQRNTRLLSPFGAWHPFALLLALTKPRSTTPTCMCRCGCSIPAVRLRWSMMW